jgi:hypothetical protein
LLGKNTCITATLQINEPKKSRVETLDLADERVAGIEPAYCAWEAHVLPLNYTRMKRKKEL